MQATVLTGKRQLKIQQRAHPVINQDEILLKVHAIGVCGSDLRIYNHGDSRINFPRVIGHEIAGEVVENGNNVSRFVPGDRVTLGAHIPCGDCIYCQQNEGHHCIEGKSMGYQVDGGFAEYVILPKQFVQNGSIQKIANTTSYELASLSEPFSCVLSGIEEVGAKAGETVVIYGAGAIGCMYIAALKRMGATKVIAVQRSKARQQKAIECGADMVIDPTVSNTGEKISEVTGGLGADTVIVTAPSAEVQRESLEIAKTTGKILYFAGIKPVTENPINTNHIIYKQLKIVGTHGAPRHLHMEAVKWIDEGLLDFSAFITHTFSLDQTDDAFQTALAKEGLKCVVKPAE
ncbi:zinc-dependent alcohol dehydrogenase [Virgibacillus ihumii]|uniref:zinc-dependent alcohol dehydrogenase n=1 Tax=Virgibacillus ihumii TaxID=2686091 RepID=UPI00157DBA32|nr:alcohol dehydrogenase catalytic domain-containing protein [Virgibacillus ihumii]